MTPASQHEQQLSFGGLITSTRRAKKPRRGRPPGRKTVSHDKRPDFAPRYPQHVTLRLHAEAPKIARMWLMQTIRRAIAESQKTTFRISEFNVLDNHLHLICEAAGSSALSRGVQGLAVRIARRVNKKVRRKGKLFATRYHSRSLKTPREVRNAPRYVLCNRKHHNAAQKFDKFWIDPFSSAPWFTGWSAPIRSQLDVADEPKPTIEPSVWLLATGWKRHKLLSFDERPA